MALIKKYDPKVPGADADKLLKPEELEYLKNVRYALFETNRPNMSTIFQKAFSSKEYSLEALIKKIEGKGNKMQISGSVITASDAKHMQTLSDMYEGLALDYPGSQFSVNDANYVLRYKVSNPQNAKIPVSGSLEDLARINPKDYVYSHYGSPFTGNGHVPGGPELFVDGDAPMEISEALIVKISPDGTEVPVAFVNKETKKFQKVE